MLWWLPFAATCQPIPIPEDVKEHYESWWCQPESNADELTMVENLQRDFQLFKVSLGEQDSNLKDSIDEALEAVAEIKDHQTDYKIDQLAKCFHLLAIKYKQLMKEKNVEHVIYKTLRDFADVHDQTDTHFEYMNRRFVSIASRYYWHDDLEGENLSPIPDRIKKCMIYSLTWAEDPALRIGEGYTPDNFDYLVIFTQMKEMAFAHLDALPREQQKLVLTELKMNVDYDSYDETTGEYKKSSPSDKYYNLTQQAKTTLIEAATRYNFTLDQLTKKKLR
jgi:hypothetical protein